MNIVCVDPRTDGLWCQFVQQAPSTVFHSPSWIQVICETYGWEAHAYVLLDDGGVAKAGLPFCRIEDMLGERIVTLPFSDHCDPLVADADSWRNLVDRLIPEHCPVTVRCLFNTLPLADKRFALAKEAKWHRLDLRPDPGALWDAMHDSTHRAIRKSQREGLSVRLGSNEEDLRSFYEMHLKVRKYKYGLLAQPYSFFQNIWRRFVETQQGFLLLAVHNGRIVAGDFFLIWKDTLYYKFNASLHDDLSCRPNDLLIWESIQHGKGMGLSYLDFGLSDIDQEGLIRYKRKFGTEEKTISFLRFSPNGGPTRVEKEIRELLGKLTSNFTDQLVPDSITERAGEDLYRLFS